MTKRQEHSFQFSADKIATAAGAEAEYHEERLAYWQKELDTAAERVKATIGATLVFQEHTGGGSWNTVIDYGDPAAQRRLAEAERKIQAHRAAAERLRSDEQLYATQRERVYELDTDDVHHYRLGGGPRED